jgi:hypothetical protein
MLKFFYFCTGIQICETRLSLKKIRIWIMEWEKKREDKEKNIHYKEKYTWINIFLHVSVFIYALDYCVKSPT